MPCYRWEVGKVLDYDVCAFPILYLAYLIPSMDSRIILWLMGYCSWDMDMDMTYGIWDMDMDKDTCMDMDMEYEYGYASG